MNEDSIACKKALKHGSRSFYLASSVLPAGFRADATALYAFCRDADDAVDEAANPAEGLEMLHRRLDAIYAGNPMSYTADRALAAVIANKPIPRPLLDALLEGFSWDVLGRQYETLSDVYDYAARVAGTVGAMMALLMGVRNRQTLARACELGVAMQLTNIARDVGEDARNGRVYLPGTWLNLYQVDRDAFLNDVSITDGVRCATAELLKAATILYQRAEAGIAVLPGKYRPAIYAARIVYAAIGDQIAVNNHDSVTGRAVVPSLEKYRLLTGLPRCMALDSSALHLAPLPEIQFLVNACEHLFDPTPPLSATQTDVGFVQRIDKRVEWVLDLFEELDRRSQG